MHLPDVVSAAQYQEYELRGSQPARRILFGGSAGEKRDERTFCV